MGGAWYLVLLASGVLGLVAGLMIGAIGVGGIILVPVLVQFPGVEIHSAIATCMLCYVFAGLVGALVYFRLNPSAVFAADWRSVAAPLFVSAIVGAGVGAYFVLLLGGFTLKMTLYVLTFASAVFSLLWTLGVVQRTFAVLKEAVCSAGDASQRIVRAVEGAADTVAEFTAADPAAKEHRKEPREDCDCGATEGTASARGWRAATETTEKGTAAKDSSQAGRLNQIGPNEGTERIGPMEKREVIKVPTCKSKASTEEEDSDEEIAEPEDFGEEDSSFTTGTLTPHVQAGNTKAVDRSHTKGRVATAVLFSVVGMMTGTGSAMTGTSGPVVLLPMVLCLQFSVLTSLALAQGIQVPIAVTATAVTLVLDYSLIDVAMAAAMTPPLCIGVAVGARMAHSVPQKFLKIVVSVTLVLASLALVVKELLAYGIA